MRLKSINPTTGDVIQHYSVLTDNQLNAVLNSVSNRFNFWRKTTFTQRADLMCRAAEVLKARKEEYATLISIEMGKAINESRAEIDKCAWVCEFYAEHAENFLADETVKTEAHKSFVSFQPIGTVLAVMPWNFPFWQVFRFAAPTLMAGNTAILKHASNVTGCALDIERVFIEAGFPANVFRTVAIGSDRVESIIQNPQIRAVSLTGSTTAGQAVASAAGRALKKSVLELGGSDPYIILQDANIESAAKICAKSRLLNNGQSCIAAKRFIVVDSVREQFEAALLSAIKKYKMGDPLQDTTQLGPMARTDLRTELHQQVIASMAAGARCLVGGEIPEDAGTFYPATLLTDVPAHSPAYQEELFGPVAAIISARDTSHAIQIANASLFGLGAAIFTQDLKKGELLATKEIDAGTVCVNTLVRSDPRLPFGGIKHSGYGRELSSYGIKEFTNVKTIYIS